MGLLILLTSQVADGTAQMFPAVCREESHLAAILPTLRGEPHPCIFLAACYHGSIEGLRLPADLSSDPAHSLLWDVGHVP